MAHEPSPPELIGREEQCAQLDRALRHAAEGGHQLVTICGPRGAGRGALLRYLEWAATAASFRVIAFTPVRHLQGVPFSAVSALIGHLRGAVADAAADEPLIIPSAAGERSPNSEIRGSLRRIIRAVATDRPLLLALEHAEWLDEASLEIILGLGRLLPPRVVLGMTRLTDGDLSSLPGDVIAVGELGEADAAELLERRLWPWGESPLAAVIAAAGGRPGDLIDLAAALSPESRAGLSQLPWPLTAPWHVVSRHSAAVAALPAGIRLGLVVAALLPGEEMAATAAALHELGDDDWLTAAEEGGLIAVEGARLRLQPPVLGLVAYAIARVSDRQVAHRAVAVAMTRRGASHLAALHEAAVTRGPDEALARRLEQEAMTAGSPAWRARLWDHAASLSGQVINSSRRRLAAAGAALEAGHAADARRWAIEVRQLGANEEIVAKADDLLKTLGQATSLRPSMPDRREPAPRPAAASAVPTIRAPSMDADGGEPEWWIQLLGDFSVRRRGVPLALPSGMPTRLLKIVALRRGVPAEEVIEHLWPAISVEQGRVRLRNVLSRLRASCGEIVDREAELLFLASRAEVDATVFEREAGAALAAAARGGPEAADLAKTAVTRYTGDLLPGDPYADWAIATRERLRRRFISLLDAIGNEAARAGDVEEAVRRLYRAIELEPYEEQRYVAGARILLDHGHRGRSLRLVRQAKKVTSELGLAPSPALLDLENRLRSNHG